jgi:hypothetical protein
MSIANFIPTLWSARLLNHLDKNTVLTQIVNRDWEGEIKSQGDTVKIQRPGNIVAGAYTKGSTIAYGYPTSSTRSLVVNQRTLASFKVDDLDQIQVNVKLMDSYSMRMGYAMADDVDRYIASLYVNAGAGDVALNISGTVNAGDLVNAFGNAALLLDNNNVPTQGRWAVISPAVHQAMLKDSRILQATDRGDALVSSGVSLVGELGGFSLYKSNNVLGTGVTVTLTAQATAGATSLACSALSAGIPAGTILTFGPGQYARVTATAATSATSITVAALDATIASAAVATYVKVRKCMFGTNQAITFANQMQPSVEALRDKDSTDDFVRAQQVYGALVVEPYALGTLTVTEA